MTLQLVPEYGFEALAGPELVVPFLLAGGVAVGAGITGWLSAPGWSAGQYNDWMRTMNDTLTSWDQLGWKYGCWDNAQLRKDFLAFWKRFSTHYKEHGIIHSGIVTDSEEDPARALMQQMIVWGATLNKCGAPVAVKNYEAEQQQQTAKEETSTDWGAVAKWGGIGLLALVGLSVVNGVRTAFQKG